MKDYSKILIKFLHKNFTLRKGGLMSTLKVIIQTILISLTFFSILFIVSSDNFFANQPENKIEPMHVFIAFIPFIILLLVSGKLKEISGPGGIGLTMRDEVQKPVFPELITPLEIEQDIVEEKGRIDTLQDKISKIHPTTLSFEIRKRNFYRENAINSYIRELRKHPNFKFILFTDSEGKFKGCMRVGDFNELMEINNIVQKIENGEILEDPRVIKNFIKITSTNKQALYEMDKMSANILPVVDGEIKFIGILTQEGLVRKILTKVLREV